MKQKEVIEIIRENFGKEKYYNNKIDEYLFREENGLFLMDIYVSYDECKIYLIRSDTNNKKYYNEYVLLYGIDYLNFSKNQFLYIIKKCIKIFDECGDLL